MLTKVENLRSVWHEVISCLCSSIYLIFLFIHHTSKLLLLLLLIQVFNTPNVRQYYMSESQTKTHNMASLEFSFETCNTVQLSNFDFNTVPNTRGGHGEIIQCNNEWLIESCMMEGTEGLMESLRADLFKLSINYCPWYKKNEMIYYWLVQSWIWMLPLCRWNSQVGSGTKNK